MKKVTVIAGAGGTKLRNSMQSVQRRVAEIARASRAKGEKGKERIAPMYRKLLETTRRVMQQAKRFYSAKNVAKAEEIGVKRVSVPNRSTKSAARRQYQKQRWFKKGQKWRTGCEGRISLLKRRHGLRRSLYKKAAGMKRWVGLGVIADNLINIGRVLAK